MLYVGKEAKIFTRTEIAKENHHAEEGQARGKQMKIWKDAEKCQQMLC